MRHPIRCGHVLGVCLFIHRYLLDRSTWSQCIEPKHVVEWNVSLFSILLGLGGIEFILCLIQVINGVLGGICGYCCSRQQVRTWVKMLKPSPGYSVAIMHNCVITTKKKKAKSNTAHPTSTYSCTIFAAKHSQHSVLLSIMSFLECHSH